MNTAKLPFAVVFCGFAACSVYEGSLGNASPDGGSGSSQATSDSVASTGSSSTDGTGGSTTVSGSGGIGGRRWRGRRSAHGRLRDDRRRERCRGRKWQRWSFGRIDVGRCIGSGWLGRGRRCGRQRWNGWPHRGRRVGKRGQRRIERRGWNECRRRRRSGSGTGGNLQLCESDHAALPLVAHRRGHFASRLLVQARQRFGAGHPARHDHRSLLPDERDRDPGHLGLDTAISAAPTASSRRTSPPKSSR